MAAVCAVTFCSFGCNTNHAQPNQPHLGRAEALYHSLGGADFVGADGGISTKIVFDWFDAHNDAVEKFNGNSGVCNGYQPAGAMAQRENTVCAGASHAWLKKESERERTH